MHRIRACRHCLTAAVAIAAISACDLLGPNAVTWNATFKVDSEQLYYCPAGNGGDLYCTTWQASNATYTGTLKEASTPQLTDNAGTWVDTVGAVHTDSTAMTFAATDNACPFY